jgi:hypothetical protein
VLFGLLVGCSNFGVKCFLLFVFCGVVRCSVDVVIPVLPNREAEVPKVSHKGWSKVCRGIFVMKVSERVVLVVCSEPRCGDSTAE